MSAIHQQLMSYGGANGDFFVIATVITSASQATISFPTIPATYRHLKLSIAGRCSTAATTVAVSLQFNGDTGSNYDWTTADRSGNTGGLADTKIQFGVLSGSTGPTNAALSTTIAIPDYIGTVFQKTTVGLNAAKVGNATAGDITGAVMNSGFWRSTSAVTSILVSCASGNFVDGTLAILYGMN